MRTFVRTTGIGLLSCLALGACQSLDSVPIDANKARMGLGYVLPFTQYTITATWRLDQCPGDPATPNVKDARIAVKIEAVAGSADDGNLAFLVDPNDLQTWTNVTSFSAKWRDGRNLISTINASAEDHTAQVLGNIVKTAVTLIPLAAGLPVGSAPRTLSPPIACAQKMLEALAEARTAKGKLDIKNDAVDAATKEVTALTNKVATMGPAVNEATKTKLSEAIDRLADAKVQQAGAVDTLTEALKPLSFAKKFTWPNSGDEFTGGPYNPSPDALDKWIAAKSQPQVHADVYLQLERLGTFGRRPGDRSAEAPDASLKGLRYRMPAQGRLVACSHTPCSSQKVGDVLASFDGPVAQLGFVNVMPFTARLFGSNSFSAEYATDGSLKSASYEQKAAPAEVATGALADAAGQLATVLDPTAKLQTQTAYLKALKDRRDALEALKPSPENVANKDSLDADTALLNSQLSNLQAEIALQEFKANHPQ